MIRTLVFDYDGTIHNTKHLYGNAFRKAYDFLVNEGFAEDRVYTDEETSIYLGLSAPEMWEKFMPDLPGDVKKTASSIIGESMDSLVYEGQAVLFDGVEETLQLLKDKGYKMAILSNCRVSYINAHREVFGLDKWFDAYYPAEKYNFIPKEEIFPEIANVFPGEYIIIGDRYKDIKTAICHDLLSIGCTFGFCDDGELAKASVLVNKFSEIPEVIENLEKNN